jgi:glutamine amidotransferase
MSNKIDVVVVDYNIGNVDSVVKAFKILNCKVVLSNKKEDILIAKKLVLPGQGSFDYGMNQLEVLNIKDLIIKRVLDYNVPILGICLGMQLFADIGYENSLNTKGLGFISGEIKKLNTKLKLPHIGWNEIKIKKNDIILKNIEDNKDFYFVHSYYFECNDVKNILSTTDYGYKFPSIIKKSNIFGVQFHPEKSLKNGIQLLKNFLNL